MESAKGLNKIDIEIYKRFGGLDEYYLNQAWVTSVLSGEDVEKALVLGRSFKRVMTTRRLVVITTPLLEHKFRTLLSREFDQIFMLDHPRDDGNGLTLKDYAKLFCFTLQIFEKCVYLDPGSLALSNCDDIFERYHSFNAVVLDNGGNAVDSSIFFFVPSMDIYVALVTTMKSKRVSCKATFEEYLKEWMLNQQKDFKFMDPKYNRRLGVSNPASLIAEEENQIGIIHFENDLKVPDGYIQHASCSREENGRLGIFELTVLEHWLSIYETEVAPLLSSLNQLPPHLPRGNVNPQKQFSESIAIIGMSCRYPGAKNLDEFWKLLVEGREAVEGVPLERWTDDRCVMANLETRNTQASFLNVPVDEFDGKFFGISPKELEFLDPQQRFLLEVTWEALEDAAVNPLSLRGTHTGVFTGAWMHDYKDQLLKAGTEEFYRTYMGNSFGAAAARISFFLGLTGPSIATESGCSSAMVAIDLACKSLREGKSPMAIACGVNLLLSPFKHDDLSFVVSPDGRCKTFDENADGFGRAEGCGVLILKRLSDAVKDGDRVWALIRGSSAAQEGLSRSLGTPTKYSEALAMKLALKDAGVEPRDVSYVETHGTGTPVGDPMEIAAIAEAYSKGRREPLIVGSVKTNIGHTESCSAMPGIMKVALSMKNEMIPMHRNLNILNPKVNLKAIPAVIPEKSVKWPRISGKIRLAGVSSFGITGTDGHLILEEAPENIGKPGIDLAIDRPLHILTLSAKTEDALDTQLEKYCELFSTKDELKFGDICFTGNTGRATFNHRAAIIAGSITEAKNLLESGKYLKQEVKETTGKTCFLFTGQGSQYQGMAKDLYKGSPIFRLHFDKCSRVLENLYNINIRDALWNSGKEKNGKLNRTMYSQTSIFCVEYCLLKLWNSWGFQPDYVLGHSLGEFTAAVAAGILQVEDAIMLVAERSKLIDNLPQGSMLVIKSDKTTVDTLLENFLKEAGNQQKWLDYAARNSNEQTVLAGDSSIIQEFSRFCEKKGVKTHVLEASHAFHSRHMNPILAQYEAIASKVRHTWTESNCVQYISSVDGKLIPDPVSCINAQYWSRHTRDKVNFLQASKVALAEGCTTFLEVGPHPVLSALMMTNKENSSNVGDIVCLPSLRRLQNDWTTILNTLSKLYLSGFQVNWNGFDQYIPRKKVERLPFYPFQRKKYWFEMNDICFAGGKSIHPLLGSNIPNASSLQFYQNGINLKNLEYLRDHCIGGKVVFPGAGYLEMCLSAGHATTQCLTDGFSLPTAPLEVRDLKILKPLLVEPGKISHVQVVVDCGSSKENEGSEETNGMIVKIFAQIKHDNEMSQWILHATSTFSPVVSNTDIQTLKYINPHDFKETLEVFGTEEFYGKLARVGLEFGPAFKSLNKVWKGKKGILAEISNLNSNGYILHPAVFDAMIQVAMIASSRGNPVDKLHVPVSIEKCIWLEQSKSSSDKLYIHSECIGNEESHQYKSILYDFDGTPLATLENVELIQTNIEQIETLMENCKSQMPLVWEEVWKPKGLGPWEKRVDAEVVSPAAMFSSDFVNQFSKWDEISEENANLGRQLDRIVYLYVSAAFQKLGWNTLEFQVGKRFQLNELMKTLSVSGQHLQLMKYFLKILEEEGNLVKLRLAEQGPTQWKVLSLLPEGHLIQQEMKSIQENLQMNKVEEFQVVMACGSRLADILTGQDSGLNILFPEDVNAPSAGKFYTGCYYRREVFEMCLKVLRSYLDPLSQQNKDKKDILRILEVGAGTGSFTQQLMTLLGQLEIGFQYTYTDISPSFFVKAEEKFEKYKKNINFKALNIEIDPTLQGFCPGYYDIVVGGDVIHATKCLEQSILNVRRLLRPNGSFLLLECTQPCREITLVFGLLEGYWQFTDFDVRPEHATVSAKTWESVMKKSGGFSSTISVTCCAGNNGLIIGKASHSEISPNTVNSLLLKPTWLFFCNNEDPSTDALSKNLQNLFVSSSKQLVFVRPSGTFSFSLETKTCTVDPVSKADLNQLISQLMQSEETNLEGVIYGWGLLPKDKIDQSSISRPYLYLLQILAELNTRKLPKVLLLSEGVIPAGSDNNYTCNPSPATLWGITKSFHNEYPCFPTRCIDLSVDDLLETKVLQIFSEVWIDDSETMVAYRNNKRLGGRLASTTVPEADLPLPSGDRFQLTLPETKSVSDLKFVPLSKYSLQKNEIEVQVKATALNFRDVFAVLKPTSYFEKTSKVGLDIAGVVTSVGESVTRWKAGDTVFGCNMRDGALPSHVILEEDSVVAVPQELTFAEAATLPAVFATSYYGLVTVANLKAGETVLLHSASGGVGLSAIQVAQHLGANIIATAGSSKKRAYLKSLGVEHVFHSRNTDYEKQIFEATKGKGVHVVLNSLTGPGFKEATLNTCAKGARFIEMSKLSVWQPEDVEKLRPDVNYEIIDLTTCSNQVMNALNDKMNEFLKKGIVQPIPYVRFDAINIRQAMTYLQRAKHIGKVVCIMPEFHLEKGRMTTISPLFNERSTYVITGGLGGIGLEVGKWMTTQGARNLILVGRSKPNDTTAEVLQQLNSKGNNVIAYSADVGDLEQCRNLIEFVNSPENKLPPLRGIMHAAGVLQDAIISNQTWEKFQACYASKIYGTWNLHRVTENNSLEFFVMFSSIAGLFGPPGQSNHAASNAFLDAFTHFRQSQGLPATSVNWGAWGQVGVAAGKEFPGVKPFSPQRGLCTLDRILREQKGQLCVAEIQMAVFQKFFGGTHVYMEDVLYRDSDKNSKNSRISSAISSEKFWKDIESMAGTEDKISVIKNCVKNVLREILKLDTNEPIDDSTSFQDMGLDSLMMVEMKNLLQTVLGKRIAITANDLKDCNNIQLIAQRLHGLIEGHSERSKPGSDSTTVLPLENMPLEEFKQLIREDSLLPPHICHKDGNSIVDIHKCRTFLITGATGNLAPYFVREIVMLSRVSKVYCLVRAKNNDVATQRLCSVLKGLDLLDSIDLSKVSCIAGDLTIERLGLKEEIYNHLATEVDAIIHCAVKANHIELYTKAPKATPTIRTVNVEGTLAVLEFACHRKTKQVLHASTLLAGSTTDTQGRLSEDWPNVGDFDNITQFGYPVSKFICDLLMKQAVLERGIPCKVFRFPGITGNSKTGRFNLQNNHLLLRLLSYLRLRAMPSVPLPINIVPSDICVNIALKIFFEPNAPPDIYNVCQLKPQHEQVFVDIAKEFGFQVDIVDFPEFAKKLENEGQDSLLYSLRDIYLNEEHYTSLFFAPQAVQMWFVNPNEFFALRKVMQFAGDLVSIIPSTTDSIRKDLVFANRVGIFEKFGVK